jgi:bcr-type benzoyl-CoA reductase subunit C
LEEILNRFREIEKKRYTTVEEWKNGSKRTLGYFCTYTPEEMIHSAGILPARILGEKEDISLADLHLPNFACSFVRSSLESALKGKNDCLDGAVFPQSCDSLQVLSDVWRRNFPGKFYSSVISPAKMNGKDSLRYFISELNRFKQDLESFIGRAITERELQESIKAYNENRRLLEELYAIRRKSCTISASDVLAVLISGMLLPKAEHTEMLSQLISHLQSVPPQVSGKPRVVLSGNICSSPDIIELIEDAGMIVVDDDLCIGSRYFLGQIDESIAPLEAIARRYLQKVHCPCKYSEDFDRGEYLLNLVANSEAQAVIFLQVKFCDPHLFDYPYLAQNLQANGIPHLLIEYEQQSSLLSPIKTRLEAFCEVLKEEQPAPSGKTGAAKYFAGIDVGSLSCDAVILNKDKTIKSYAIAATGARSAVAIKNALDMALKEGELSENDITSIISTGYGRKNVEKSLKNITEISCHAKGAHFLFPKTRTVIDIGGQDSKVIKVGDNGRTLDFAMNDKCAAGTGRFLEVMAHALEIELDDFGEVASRGTKALNISSICTIFAESEVISLIAQGEKAEDIARGLCNAIARRLMPMIQRVGSEEEFTMTGGVAKNKGVVLALEQMLNTKFNIPDEPQIVGALGAALIGLEEHVTE